MKNVVAGTRQPIALDSLKKTRVYQIMEKLNATNKITRDDADFVARWLNNNKIFDDAIPYFGWKFEFAGFMQVYEVQLEQGKRTLYGFDKESVRKSLDVEIEDNMILLTS